MNIPLPLAFYEFPRQAAILSMLPILWGLLLIRYRESLNMLPVKVFHQFAGEKSFTGCIPVLLGILLILAGLVCLVLALIDLIRNGGAA